MSDFLVPEHNQLYIKMLEFEGKYFHLKAQGVEHVESNSELHTEEWLYNYTNKQKSKHGFESGMMVVVDETKVKKFFLKVNGNYRVPSSFGAVTFNINKNAGYVDFEFSIPKYLYGHSLAEFIPQPKSKTALRNFDKIHQVDHQFALLWDRLMAFIDRFFLDLCHRFELDTLLNKKYVEITRIDFVKNQYFENKQASLDYLRHLQAINVRRYSNNAKVASEYDTSLTYKKSDGSYFKVYHKGTEYISSKYGDLKKHEEINSMYLERQEMPKDIGNVYTEKKKFIQFLFNKKTKGEDVVIDAELRARIKETVNWIYEQLPFKTDFLKGEMDKVLRYESSLTNAYFTQLYKRKLFRRKDSMHRMAMIKYSETKKKYDARYEDFGERVVFKEKRNHDMVNRWLNRKCHFMLETNTMLKNYEERSYMNYDATTDYYNIEPYPISETILKGKDVATFSPELFKLLFKSFWSEYRYYQVEKVENFDDMLTKVKDYNEKAVKNADAYNERNSLMVRVHNAKVNSGEILGKKVKKATQLLTQKEIMEKGFKKVSVMHMVTILRMLEKGMSLKQVFVKLGFSANQRSRFRKDLKLFNITEQSVMRPKAIKTSMDFRDYYHLAGHRNKIEKFFVTKEMQRYG